MERKIRVALVGFGTMGRIYARMIFAGMIPGMSLAGVCCRNTAGQQILREEYPGVAIYPNAEEMARFSGDFDAVLIVTPHTSHISIGMEMARLGKHLLLDKPAGVIAGEVEQLVAFCEEKGLSFGMIFNNRRLPVYQAAKKYLESGILGQLQRAVWVCNNWYRSPAYHRSGTWRSSWNGECGGLLINQLPHNLDLLQWLLGMPEKLYADIGFGRYNDFLVDDAVDIQMSYANGVHTTLISATGEAPGVNRLEIWGTKGKLVVEDHARLYLDENEVSTTDFAKINEIPFGTIPHAVRDISLQEQENPYQQYLENFAAHLLYGTPLFADGREGLKEVQLANAAYVSGWEGCRVTVPVEGARFEKGLAQRQKEEKEQ